MSGMWGIRSSIFAPEKEYVTECGMERSRTMESPRIIYSNEGVRGESLSLADIDAADLVCIDDEGDPAGPDETWGGGDRLRTVESVVPTRCGRMIEMGSVAPSLSTLGERRGRFPTWVPSSLGLGVEVKEPDEEPEESGPERFNVGRNSRAPGCR